MTEENVVEVKPEELPAYKVYTVYQIVLTILADLFCMSFVAAITFVIYKTGNTKLVWLFLLPALCFIFG